MARIAALPALAHTGADAEPTDCLLDEDGRLYLASPLGLGLVHTLDVGQVANAVEAGLWMPTEVASDSLPARFGYVLSPAAGLAAT